MPEPDFVAGPVTKKDSLSAPNASIWLNMPVLGDITGQSYYGRVVVEVWDEGELEFHTSYPNEPGKTAYLLERATLALQSANTPVLTTMPWSDEPVMGGLRGQTFRGRVVVEVWDGQATIAIRGSDGSSDLAHRAAQKLLQVTKL